MGQMADYFIDGMIDEELAVRDFHQLYPDLDGMTYIPVKKGYWNDGEGVMLAIRSMTDDHIGAAIGWCRKHGPEEKVAELKAEQVRREFTCL